MNDQSKQNSNNLLNLKGNLELKPSLAIRALTILTRLEQRLCQLTNDSPEKRSMSYGEG